MQTEPESESTRTLCARAISALGRDLRDTFPPGACGGQDRIAGDMFNRTTASVLSLLALTEQGKGKRKPRRRVGKHGKETTAIEAAQGTGESDGL